MTALVLGHKNPDTDSIVAALAAANLYKGRGIDVKAVAQGAPAPETEFVLKKFNLSAPEIVSSIAGNDVYLVDYSDLSQSPEDFTKAKLLGIIDHHKLGDVTSDSPVECWIQPVGCSNTVIKIMHDFYGVAIDKNLAGAMLCAILSDTVLFKSPTCTDADKKAAAELAAIAGITDMLNINSKDDALTLLIHLGYLAYDNERKEVYIPNQEVADEFRNSVEYSNWEGVSAALEASDRLLDATLRMDADQVAEEMDKAHMANTSIQRGQHKNIRCFFDKISEHARLQCDK